MKFSVKRWAARSPSLTTREDWLNWSSSPGELEPEQVFKSQLVPKMMARRCSQLSLLALDVALELTESHMADFGVFASRHGEISRTLGLISSIAKREDLSPTAFSQSVHNTAAGLFTIIKKSNFKVSSIAAGPKTLQMAFVEAYAYLKEFKNQSVLLVYFDQELPEIYQRSVVERSLDFAVGLILELPENDLGSTFVYAPKNKSTAQGYEFLSGFLAGDQAAVEVNIN